MTREEAVKYAEEKLGKGLYRLDLGYLNRGLYQIVAKEVDFMRVAISALRGQPVVHGRWKFGKNHGEFVETECTACGSLLLVKWIDELSNYRYCPNCGARMDGDSIDK